MQHRFAFRSASLPPIISAVIASAVALSPGASAEQVERDVIYVPTPQPVVEKMLEMAKVTEDDYVIDLGSGDGRIPITAAKKFGATAFGIDIDPQRIEEARENLKEAGVEEKVTFKKGNLFEQDLSKADVITMYLLNSINMKLRPKLLELEPGTRIVSHAFDMDDWKADQTETVDGKTAFLWIVPAQVEGEWKLTGKNGETYQVTLDQTFQNFEGQAKTENSERKITDGELNGKEIEFRLAGEEGKNSWFKGAVNGDQMQGDGWEATRAED